MSGLKENCEKYFGATNFYEILKVSQNATSGQIKKAYHKLSLVVHPDRVEAAHKLIATEKFKVLGKIHSILQDENKRKIYDDCGEFDEENESDFNWMDYWRSLFKKISLNDIKNFEKEYIGSETEIRDIKKAYIANKGDMTLMMEFIPFSNIDSEPRIIEIVRGLVDKGELEEYDCFFNEPAKKRRLRHKQYQKEKEEVEKESWLKKTKLEQFSNLEKDYIGSENEYIDIKTAYESFKGDMTKMMNLIPFVRLESESRIIEIVQGMVERNEVQKFDLFFNEPPSKKIKRHRRLQREKEAVEGNSMEELETAFNEIQARTSTNLMDFTSLEAKYGNKKRKLVMEETHTAEKRRISRK